MFVSFMIFSTVQFFVNWESIEKIIGPEERRTTGDVKTGVQNIRRSEVYITYSSSIVARSHETCGTFSMKV